MKKRKPSRFGLVFLFTIVIFLTLLITVALFGSVMMVMLQAGWFRNRNFAARMFPIVVSAVGALAVGTLISNMIVRIPLHPIRRLIEAMRRLSEGHFEERLELEAPLGEMSLFREMAETFNLLAGELQSTEMLRSDFVNNFSHEFKTPIVSISGFAQILQNGDDLSEEERREYLDIIVDESARLSHMATSVLNLTKIENQTILTDVTRYNVSEQVRKCILMLEKKWSKKDLRFVAEFGEYFICGNMPLLNQVWLNLLDNAVKFSPEGAEVGADIRKAGEGLEISFTNHGPEIDREQMKRLYDRFWQGDASHAAEGTGIGLSIVKKIVALHKGRVEVRSSPEETVFSVYLPETDDAQ